MADFTRRDVRRLKPELKYILREVLRKSDLSGLIAWLHKYGNHLSLERQSQMVAECREIINDESGERKR
jgi:hypothetical protein